MNEVPRQRLFFALWPDPAVRDALAELARRLSDNPVRMDNLHLTLAFLGERTAVERTCAEQAAATLAGEPFRLSLDYIGAFPRPRLQWVGTQHCPEALTRLMNGLWGALVPCGIAREERRFVPHVTLARHIIKPVFQILEKTIEWDIEELVLAESRQEKTGTHYEIISRWPLG